MYSPSGFGDLAPSLSFTKSTGGAANVFQSGESWVATVTGPANQNVWVVANGLPPVNLGLTDSTGRFTKSAAVGDGEIGNWNETWYVGGMSMNGVLVGATNVGTVNFSVVAKPAPTNSNQQNNNAPPPPPPIPLPTASSIPSWAWLAGAGLAAVLLLGGKR